MNPKIEPGGRGRIPYLLRCAFVAAKEGDRDEAMGFWRQAIEEGYQAKGRVKKQLMFLIRDNEKSSLDPGDEPSTDGVGQQIMQRMRDRSKKIN